LPIEAGRRSTGASREDRGTTTEATENPKEAAGAIYFPANVRRLQVDRLPTKWFIHRIAQR
jgi:hypothetical protein